MRVAELMQKHVKVVAPEASLAELVVSLADAHISALPVVDGGGRMVGVVSNTDLIAAEAESEGAAAELFENTLVRDIMTPRALTVPPNAEVKEAAQQMLYAEVHRLFVAAGDRLVGVISATDIVRAVATGKI